MKLQQGNIYYILPFGYSNGIRKKTSFERIGCGKVEPQDVAELLTDKSERKP